MGSYHVILKPAVEKDLRSLPRKILARFFERFEALENEPLPRQSLKLEGTDELYRVRVGDYRIIYEMIARKSKLLYIMSAIVGKSIADCNNSLFDSPGEIYG